MPLGEGGPHERGDKEEHPLKKRYFAIIGSSNVTKWLQIGTDMLLIITSTGNELLRNVKVDDIE